MSLVSSIIGPWTAFAAFIINKLCIIFRITRLLEQKFFSDQELRILEKHMQEAIQQAKMAQVSHQVFLLLCSALTLLHTERPKLHTILAFLSAVGLIMQQLFVTASFPSLGTFISRD